MSDDTTLVQPPAETPAETPEPTGAPTTPTPNDLDKPLGPQGESALRAEKARRREESAKRRELETELAILKTKIETPVPAGEAVDVEAIRADATREAIAAANDRVRRSEVRVAASDLFADPSDALKFVNLDQVHVDGEGNVDGEELKDILAAIVASKPYLGHPQRAAIPASDAGVRKGSAEGKPEQISKDKIRSMTPEAIEQARKAGQLDQALGIIR
jgi:hypothetical protein